MNSKMIDLLAHRVADRHVTGDVPATPTRIEHTNCGLISAMALANILRPTTGPVAKLKFHRPPNVAPNVIAWAAIDPNGSVVAGTLVLHTAVCEDQVVIRADIEVDRDGTNLSFDPADLALVREAFR
jgi:hypothetical protein